MAKIQEFEQCCWDVRAILSKLGPDEACCEGLTPRQCRVLRAVGRAPDTNLSALADGEGLTVSGMSRRVDPLVEAGYLARRRGGAEDGREIRLELTKKGRDTLASVEDLIFGGIADLWGALAPGERSTVVEAMKILSRAGRTRKLDGPARPVESAKRIPLRTR